jgi:hypothetical protein
LLLLPEAAMKNLCITQSRKGRSKIGTRAKLEDATALEGGFFF